MRNAHTELKEKLRSGWRREERAMASTSLSAAVPTRLRPRPFSSSKPNSRYSTSPTSFKLFAPSLKPLAALEHGSPDQFLENNSIADFMRFRRGIHGGSNGELQTAVVSYRKKFPWSLLQPFLQVPFFFFFIFLIYNYAIFLLHTPPFFF